MARNPKPLERAILILGGQSATARALDTRQSTVAYWLKSGRAAADKVARMSELTGIPPHELRPDIFPAPGKERAA